VVPSSGACGYLRLWRAHDDAIKAIAETNNIGFIDI